MAKAQRLQRLIDALPEPVVAIDPDGVVLADNAAFRALRVPARDLPRRASAGGVVQTDGGRFRLERLEAAGEARCYRLRPAGEDGRERALSRYLEALADGHSPLEASAEAAWEGIGWRWTFVTRFDPRMLKQVQVIHWLEQGRAGEPFDYAVDNTPCERVFGGSTDACSAFADLPSTFPDDPWIQRVGAQEYVGQVFRTRAGVPLGHLFTISDRPQPGREMARRVISLLGQLVSTQLQALSWGELVDRAHQRAHRDALTRVANRSAFEQALELFERIPTEERQPLTVVWLDLDGLKQVNDTAGHHEGDRMLITFAHHLASETRADDNLFRVGGDEFVLMLTGGSDREQIDLRVERVTRTLREHGFDRFSVSYGVAESGEARSLGDAVRLADRRMYQMKQARQASR